MATTNPSEIGKSADLPLIVDLGRKPRKQIKKLTEGGGKLLDEVDKVIQELRVAGKLSGATQPVVIVVKERRRQGFPWSMI